MNWNLDTPEGRLACIEALGPEGYNDAMREKFAADTVATVNGHAIRKTASRFGLLFTVGRTGRAFRTLDEATIFANEAFSA
ncbi:hypothetical protein OKW45_001976 [Paraburkholderia sp. WSM4175]|uniref:hypothetical protein n=1 Tax=Paraburkholderia sp. WSM4175 TaxID=2991072 RepID=UPI003D1D925A